MVVSNVVRIVDLKLTGIIKNISFLLKFLDHFQKDFSEVTSNGFRSHF